MNSLNACKSGGCNVIGDPLDEATDIGTIVSPGQFERVRHYAGLAEATDGFVARKCSTLPIDERLAGLFVQL